MTKLRLFQFTAIFLVVFISSSCEQDDGFKVTGDLTPIIAVGSPSGSTVNFTSDRTFNFNILFTDDNGLANFSLLSSDLGVDVSKTLDGEKVYEYTESLDISSDFGSFPLIIRVEDQAGNASTDTITFIKEEVLGSFVYAVGGASWNSWDPSKAMQMEEDTDNPGWFKITLYGDGTKDNGEVKFIGQLDWSPNNWGPESNTEIPDSGESTGSTINSDGSGTLILPNGYSEVSFNPELGQYRVVPLTDALPEPNGQFFVMGCGFQDTDGNDIDLCWDPSKAYPMNQDAVNPYLYRVSINFSSSVDLKFNGNQSWDDLDWGFPNGLGDEMKIAPDGDVLWTRTGKAWGADWKFFDRQGTYELILDEYLGTSQIRKSN
ncbi:MAG: hypothetical protein RIC35_25050 [Marinoscillum sp.]